MASAAAAADGRDTVKKLRHLGRKLSKNLASSVDNLLELLDKLELVLSNLDQDPDKPIQQSLVHPMKALISDELLRHTDNDVKVSVTACLTEVARITAPNAPYEDEQMKEFFKLTVAAFENLSHVSGRRYDKALAILENLSKIKIFFIMLDLECDDLVIQMFNLFLRIIRANHSSNVIESMETVMTGILDESEDISSDLLRPLLDSVRKENQIISPISWTLGEKVFTNCAVKLKPYLMQAVDSSGRALDEYAQIVASICKNQSESPEPNHSTVQATENIVDVPKDAHEKPCDVTRGFETDNICVRDAEITDDTNLKMRSTNAVTVDAEFTKSSETTNSERRDTKTNSETSNLESVQKLNSETQLDTVPRKRARKPNSLLNPEEGYDHSWIYRKSSRSRKASNNGNALSPAGNSTSSKDKTQPKPETVGESLENGNIAKPAQPENPSDKSSDVPSIESPASTKEIRLSNPEDMSKAHEALVSEPKHGENTNAVPFTKHTNLDGSSAKRCRRRRKISSIGDQNDHPNSASILKDENLNTLLKKTSSESPGARLKKKSEIRKDSAVTHEEPVRNIKLSIKFDGKIVVPPVSVVAKMESEVLCENEGKDKSSTDMKVENREEGRSSDHIEVNKRRRRTATSNKGFNKSSAMKAHEPQELGNSLVGRRIKVWWRLDKTYYDGVVNAYDHVKGKHKVVYDDDYVEQLNLKKHRWELVDANVLPDEAHEPQEQPGNSLVGKRIKVWWPLDKTYYDGVVNAYDHVKGKHKLLYDDGYVEQLNLKKHRWELVDANVLPDEVSKNLYIIHSDTDTIRKLAGAYDMAEKNIEKFKLKSLKGKTINSFSRSDLVDDSVDDPQ
ncbi:Tudor/PWWP/MBT superfamily protein [Trifolium repens]|nr:Tudor/PWWP/MBT superfamily protein [Trifolium repens]